MATWADFGTALVKNRSLGDLLAILIIVSAVGLGGAIGFGYITLDAYATETYVDKKVAEAQLSVEDRLDKIAGAVEDNAAATRANTESNIQQLQTQYGSTLSDVCSRLRDVSHPLSRSDKRFYEDQLTEFKAKYLALTKQPWQGPSGC